MGWGKTRAASGNPDTAYDGRIKYARHSRKIRNSREVGPSHFVPGAHIPLRTSREVRTEPASCARTRRACPVERRCRTRKSDRTQEESDLRIGHQPKNPSRFDASGSKYIRCKLRPATPCDRGSKPVSDRPIAGP